MTSSNFRGMQLRKEWPRDCKFGKSLIVINFGQLYSVLRQLPV